MKITNSLTGKISLGYITIAVISMIASIVSLFLLNQNKSIDKQCTTYSVPTLVMYKDLNVINNELKRLSNSWIYTPNQADKQRLQKLVKEDIASTQLKLESLIMLSDKTNEKNDLIKASSFIKDAGASALLVSEKLATDEDYADDEKVDAALTLYDKTLLPIINQNDVLIKNSIVSFDNYLTNIQVKKESTYNVFYGVLVFMFLIILITGIISLRVSKKIIIDPINELKDVVNKMGNGEILEIALDNRDDEIGEMRKSMRSMVDGFKSNTNFAIEIGKGNYDVAFTPLSKEDQLGNALLDMRVNLKKNAEDESRRSWATMGIANIGELLRKNDNNEEELYDQIISSLVKYLGANQGGLFILETDSETNESYLELKSCYAYNRKKYKERKIEIGEGLIGQCYLEQETIFMTEIPSNYITITSGLGDATPNTLLIVPLKVNDAIFGILELASFTIFEKYHVDFVEKIAESIGSVISNVKINQRTRKLLEESQMQSEALRAQEEEMRQNMEELAATQEEMSRKEQEYLQVIANYKAANGVSASN